MERIVGVGVGFVLSSCFCVWGLFWYEDNHPKVVCFRGFCGCSHSQVDQGEIRSLAEWCRELAKVPLRLRASVVSLESELLGWSSGGGEQYLEIQEFS